MGNVNYTNRITLTLRPGETVILNVEDAFAAEVGPNGEELLNGFYVVNGDLGKVESVSDKEGLYVRYTQLEIGHNTVLFHAYNPAHSALFNVIHIPVHDHADMSTGGPSYATYDSVINKEETNQQEQ